MWLPLWSKLVCKIPQFLTRSFRFIQFSILFQKLDTLRLLKIYVMLSPPPEAKYPFFQAPAHGVLQLYILQLWTPASRGCIIVVMIMWSRQLNFGTSERPVQSYYQRFDATFRTLVCFFFIIVSATRRRRDIEKV